MGLLAQIRAVHNAQDATVVKFLPPALRTRFDFQDANALVTNLAARAPRAWGGMLASIAPLTQADLNAMADVDQGTKRINPRTLERFKAERTGR